MEPTSREEEKPKKPKSPPSPEELQREFTNLIKDKFGGNIQVMAMGPNEMSPGEDDSNKEEEKIKVAESHIHIKNFKATPKDIRTHLDKFVVGQDEAKKALSVSVSDHYHHLKASLDDDEDRTYQKQNVLILGPTGVGKTYLVKKVADFIGVPFVKADATRFSEVGYMGANVDDVIRNLVEKADGDISLAEKGIVYIDEIDKIAGSTSRTQKDVGGRGVQFGFLRLLEDSKVDLNSSHDIASQFKTLMSFQKSGKAKKEVVSTKNILFIFSGAFHGVEKIVEKRLNKNQIGLHGSSTRHKSENLDKVQAEDLVEFGFEHEFVGRLPVRASCHNLNQDHLLGILDQSEDSIVDQYKYSFNNFGIRLSFTKEALQWIAKKAEKQKTGARALSSVMAEILNPFKYELPSTDIRELKVDGNLVKNPEGVLHHLIGKI